MCISESTWFWDMLLTNAPLMDIQLQEIRQRQEEIKQEINALETGKSSIDIPNEISFKIDALKMELDLSALLTSPMRGLPFDILAAIFEQVPRTPSSNDDRRTALSPLHLSHVCRDWRYTAINVPQLWTFFDIQIFDQVESELNPQKYERVRELADLWFSRARRLPLAVNIKVLFGPRSFLFARRWIEDFLIRRQSAIYSIAVDSNNTAALLYNFLPTQFPRLEKVLIHAEPESSSYCDVNSYFEPIFTLFENTPNLKQLICLSERTRPTLTLPLSYRLLSRLILTREMSLQEWINVMCQMTQLSIGVFHIEDSFNDSLPTQTITFKHLKLLYIYCKGDFPCSSLHSFKFPVLNDFRLYFRSLTGPKDILYDKIKDARSLAIRRYGRDLKFNLITSMRHRFEMVDEFEYFIKIDEDVETFFELFEVGDNFPPPLLPQLKKLTLRVMRGRRGWCRPWLEDVDNVENPKRTIRSRWEAAQRDGQVSPLMSLHIIASDLTDEDMETRSDLAEYCDAYPDQSGALSGLPLGQNERFQYCYEKTTLVADRMEIFEKDLKRLRELQVC